MNAKVFKIIEIQTDLKKDLYSIEMPQVVGQTRHRLPPGSLGFAFWIFFAKNKRSLHLSHHKLSNKVGE